MSTTIETPERVAEREKQMREAEDLLAAMPQKMGVAKAMFEGRFVADWVFPYPQIPASQRTEVEQAVAELERFCDEHLDPVKIDREADIPREVIDGIAEAGRTGHDGADAVRRPRVLADGLLPAVGGDRCAVQLDGDLRQRAPFDRDAGAALVWHRSAEAVVAARPGQRAQACGVRADGAGSRFRCRQRADDGHSHDRMARVSCSMAKSDTSRTGQLPVC